LSEFSQQLIERSGYLNEGFPGIYDRYRPSPLPGVLDVLTFLVGRERPGLAVDLGCGTGLATRALAERVEEVVGIEPNATMLAQARAATDQPNVRYVEAFANDTRLDGGTADIVTAWQAFHWMQPQPALAEAARILRDGGIFAACDYDVPPIVQPDVDDAFTELIRTRREARQRLALPAGSTSWPKERHLEEIRASGQFRYAREVVASGWWETNAERMIGLAESIGGPREMFGDAAPEVGETFERLRETAILALGDRPWRALLCYRIRVGIK
jgi:ubiquinone/menaquinone biosynthesis C-methylase UbiE